MLWLTFTNTDFIYLEYVSISKSIKVFPIAGINTTIFYFPSDFLEYVYVKKWNKFFWKIVIGLNRWTVKDVQAIGLYWSTSSTQCDEEELKAKVGWPTLMTDLHTTNERDDYLSFFAVICFTKTDWFNNWNERVHSLI